MAGEYNVSVLATLRNRVSQGLRFIARDFQGAERNVRSLQRAINDLQRRRDMYAATSGQRADVERRTTADLEKQLATRKAILAQGLPARQTQISSLEKEADERERTGKIAAENLKRSERANALAAVQARRAKDDVQIQKLKEDVQKRQLAISEDQALINRRNAMAQIRSTETQNRLMQQQNAIRERQIALSAERADARRARITHALNIGAGVALAGAGVALEFAKAGLPVGMYLQQIRQGGRLSRDQASALPQMAMGLSVQSTQFTYKEVLKALRQLIPVYGFGATQKLAPSIFALAGLEKERGLGSSLTSMSMGVAQTLATLHARTPAQKSDVLNTLTTMLYRTGGAVSPESMEQTLRTMASANIKMPFAKQLQAGALTTMIMAEAGKQGHLSAPDIAGLFRALLTPHLGSQLGLMQLMTPAGRAAIKHGDILKAVELFPKGLTMPQRFLGGKMLPEIYALQQAMGGHLLARIQAQLANMISPQVALAKSMSQASPAMTFLGTSLDNFVTAIGAAEDKHIAKGATFVGRAYNSMAQDITKYGFWGGLAFALGGGERNATLGRPGITLTHPYNPLNQGPRSGLLVYPDQHSPVHVTINLDGKQIYDGVAKNATRHLRHSAMSNTKARGPAVSPHVYPGGK